MGKLGNKFPDKQYTTTDQIKYLEQLPDCIPNTCQNPFDNNLTNVLKLLLEKYCEKEIDLTEADVECLLEANPDITPPEEYEAIDLINFLTEHICYIYTQLCAICCDECGGEVSTDCTIEKTIPCVGLRRLVLLFPEEINYTTGEDETVDLVVTLPGAADGSSKVFTIAAPFTVEDILDQIEDEWENLAFTVSSSGNTLYLVYSNQFQSPTFTFNFTYSEPTEMLTLGNLNGIDFFAQSGSVSGAPTPNVLSGTFVWNACTEEETGPICDFIQDHEDRITIIENQQTPEPYVPEIITIPVYRVLDLGKAINITIKLTQHIKNSTDYNISNNGTTVATNQTFTTDLVGKYTLTQTPPTVTYTSFVHEEDDDFDIYVHNNTGTIVPLNVVITKIIPCCEDVEIPCDNEEYALNFSTNVWGEIDEITQEELEVIMTSGGLSGGVVDGTDVYYPLPQTHTWSLQRIDCDTSENVGDPDSNPSIEIDTMPGDPTTPAIRIPLSYVDITEDPEEQPMCFKLIGDCITEISI